MFLWSRILSELSISHLVSQASPFTKKGMIWRLTCNFRVELEFVVTCEMTSCDVWTSLATCNGENGFLWFWVVLRPAPSPYSGVKGLARN